MGAAFAITSNPLIALDFAHAQSLLAVGVKDFGLAERWRYQRLVQEPQLPESVFDIGTFTEPNLELLAEIKPLAILHSKEWPTDTAQLRRIAPLVEMSIYTGAPAPLDRARQALLRIAEIAGEGRRASDYLAGFDERMRTFRDRLRLFEGKRVMVLWAATPRDFWTLGSASLVHDVLDRVGLGNAITEPGDIWGWLPVTMHELARLDDVIAFHFGPIPNALDSNPFWQNLGLVRWRRLVVLPSSWLFGGVPEAERMARLLTHALEGSDHLSIN
ncbi:ABC transporter substrate-binding protein [Ancylobacter sp. A5.8]|uniref:ABC transporter substrate-binding protein n=1 Tax=Ancylobacter gelatini TaxID=2919920 RepID=UPI001F4DF223|nr:ABC transporter substrate-binding protein [Ancylobacter gelatini]MCJ8145104.1 ABC transporter substrate-binding protein [Ancylobacter gelatini]